MPQKGTGYPKDSCRTLSGYVGTYLPKCSETYVINLCLNLHSSLSSGRPPSMSER